MLICKNKFHEVLLVNYKCMYHSSILSLSFYMQRQFPSALDVGCGRGHIARHMDSDIIKTLVQCDYAELPLVSVPV